MSFSGKKVSDKEEQNQESNNKKSQSIAEQAFQRILSEGLTPSPENYRVWHVYYSGADPQVVHALDMIEKNKDEMNDHVCMSIYKRYLSEDQSTMLINQASDIVNKTIANVTGIVNDARELTSDYSVALNGFQGQLHDNMSADEVQLLLAPILAQTQSMLKENQRLESELKDSSDTMDELKRELDLVRKEALTDSLTGVANRKSFDVNIKRLIDDTKRKDNTFSMIMLDIDHFKEFNDNFGHQLGDQVLRLVARTLTDGVKGRDIVCRYGGEEFIVLLPETNIMGAERVASDIRMSVEERELVNKTTGEKIGHITISGGVAEYRAGESLDDIVERADNALYTAKNNGRNQIVTAPMAGQGD